jgi:hypothetical protein
VRPKFKCVYDLSCLFLTLIYFLQVCVSGVEGGFDSAEVIVAQFDNNSKFLSKHFVVSAMTYFFCVCDCK